MSNCQYEKIKLTFENHLINYDCFCKTKRPKRQFHMNTFFQFHNLSPVDKHPHNKFQIIIFLKFHFSNRVKIDFVNNKKKLKKNETNLIQLELIYEVE